MALKEAERKQLEKDRLAEEREQQKRHLTHLLQSGVFIHSAMNSSLCPKVNFGQAKTV